ncbi:MAG: sialate O-acetylesterase [Bacteroidota bacterium]|nr:sialate O-acetylesterase [Bacteroidota bacterium]
MNNHTHNLSNYPMINQIILFCCIVFISAGNLFAQSTIFEMAPLFQDSMVLQQKSAVPLWGKGMPGTRVMIRTSWGKSSSTSVDADSSWMAKLSTPKAGGPYKITISHGQTKLELRNVLIGEVWLCSGQSNMEMPVEGWPATDTASGLSGANFPKIRIYNVKRNIATEPQSNCTGTWQECTPTTIASFSAAGYFFGKKLFQELKIPIGLIQSTWGGTPVEAWTSEKYITQHDDYKNFKETFTQGKIDNEKYMEWLATRNIINVEEQRTTSDWRSVNLNDSLMSRNDLNDSGWAVMNLPSLWESSIGNYNGVLWFRKKIEIPQLWRNKELVIELSMIDDYDITFVNNSKVGGIDTGAAWNKKRIYTIPAEIVKDSIVSIAVRVIDVIGGGGIYGQQNEMNIHPKDSEEKISLAGDWKYSISAEFRDNKLYAFDNGTNDFKKRPTTGIELSSQVPTALYNGMIAPLIPYTLKGAIWYQGEGNTGNPEAYKELFTLMIKNWREDWKNNLSFYFVQIAPFQYGERTPSQKLREAQFQTLSVPKTGMAVTLDIGDSSDIHPLDKKSVGERLARWALAKDYGKKIQYSGPLYKSFKILENKIHLSFTYGDGIKIKPSNGKTYFQIAGEDSVFKDATVTIKKNVVIVSSDEVKHPIAVRYGWNNIVQGTLFNKYELPASSFRTDNWKN